MSLGTRLVLPTFSQNFQGMSLGTRLVLPTFAQNFQGMSLGMRLVLPTFSQNFQILPTYKLSYLNNHYRGMNDCWTRGERYTLPSLRKLPWSGCYLGGGETEEEAPWQRSPPHASCLTRCVCVCILRDCWGGGGGGGGGEEK